MLAGAELFEGAGVALPDFWAAKALSVALSFASIFSASFSFMESSISPGVVLL